MKAFIAQTLFFFIKFCILSTLSAKCLLVIICTKIETIDLAICIGIVAACAEIVAHKLYTVAAYHILVFFLGALDSI